MSVRELEIDGKRLKKARGNRNMEDVAKAVGISRQFLFLLEKGTCEPSATILARLSWLYDKQIEYFIRPKKQADAA